MRIPQFGICIAALLVLAVAPSMAQRVEPASGLNRAMPKKGGGGACQSSGCHEGIESINPKMNFNCVVCHKGQGSANDHDNIYANPADLRVIDKTCGKCHRRRVEDALKSLHSTSAGVISGTRWTWAAQDTKNALYANYDVSDEDGNVPADLGALNSLMKIPQFNPGLPEGPDNTPADDYLRNQCLRCHLWSGGHERDGDWRASGCAACHVVYSDSGLYEGGDETIDPSEKGHPIRHEITTKVPEYQCIHCHNRGGRTGVSFIGTMESDGYGSPWTATGGKQPKLHSKNYNHLEPDIHYKRGMTCIDCHTSRDLHGDGNIYSKKEQAVEIECVDCHGTMDAESDLLSSGGNRLTNLQRTPDGTVVLTAKLDGSLHVVPQIKNLDLSVWGTAAMRGVSRHMEQLECYACHATWTPQCYGCHAKQDLGTTGRDWIDPVPHSTDPSKTALKAAADASQIAYGWAETRSYLSWETPILGINADHEGNKTAPFIPGCQVVFTQIGEDGTAVVHNRIYTTEDDTSGFAHNPIQPHTVQGTARRCEDCHNTVKAQGLGTGAYLSRANGLDIDFELERIVDESGNQIQTTSHVGARPLNADEMNRMNMDLRCEDCHINGVP